MKPNIKPGDPLPDASRPARQEHACCWHFKSGISYGFGGTDTEQCCFCGTTRTRSWHLVADPAHGPFAPHTLTAYHD